MFRERNALLIRFVFPIDVILTKLPLSGLHQKGGDTVNYQLPIIKLTAVQVTQSLTIFLIYFN